MPYRLLAMDMDGTVLNSKKNITPRTEEAVHTAISAGKEVLFATGRCLSEMREHLARFPEMRYAICLSGATVVDLQKGVTLSVAALPRELVEQIMAMAHEFDVMVAVYAGNDVFLEDRHRGKMEYYGCGCFEKLYGSCAGWVEESGEAIALRGGDVRKINFYFHSTEEWEQGGRKLTGLPVSYARGIPNNYEISPLNVTKGMGLEALCRRIGIPITQAIAVGDEGNDLAMIETAGLGVAMGNASQAVKDAADEITADCDHDGVAEVIEKYLLP